MYVNPLTPGSAGVDGARPGRDPATSRRHEKTRAKGCTSVQICPVRVVHHRCCRALPEPGFELLSEQFMLP